MMQLCESSQLSVSPLTVRNGEELERQTERWRESDQRGIMEEDREWRGQRRASVVMLTIQICTVESNKMRGSEMRQ